MATKQSANKKKKSTSKKLNNSSRFSRSALLLFILVFAGIGAYFLLHSFAAPSPPTVYLSVASNVNGPNTSFSVQVRENSGATGVNVVEAHISYPSTLLSLVGNPDYTGSAFATQAQSTLGTGTIVMIRGIPAPTCNTPPCAPLTPVTGDQLVATLNFKTLTTGGTANVAFTTGTQLFSYATSADILGGLAATAGGSYVIDTTPPSVSITAPTNNSTVSVGNTVSVTAGASDTQSALSKVEFYIDGTLAGTVTASPYTYAWNTTGVTLASHALTAKAYDSSGNVATSSAVNVTVADQTPPSAPTNFRATGGTLNSESLAWNASTDNIAVTGYKITRGGVLIATVTPPTLTYNDTGLAPATPYTYVITAVDATGNTSTATTLNVTTVAVTPGDVNLDGHVNSGDLTLLLANFGTAYPAADFNHTGTVDAGDFSTILSHFGS